MLHLFLFSDDELPSTDKEGIKIIPGRPKQILTLQKLHKTFDIWFDFYQKVYDANNYRSVFRLTTTTQHRFGKLGCRLPVLLTQPGNKLYIGYTFKTNIEYQSKPSNKVGHWIRINIRQKLTNGKYMFEIFIDGKLIDQKENTDPQEFDNVMVFTGDEFFDPVNGRYNNFKIASPAHDAIIGKFLLDKRR